MNKLSVKLLIFSLVTIVFVSCGSKKNIAYFQDISTNKQAELENAAVFTEPLIQADDLLSITVFTIDPQSGSVINQAASNNTLGTGANGSLSGQTTPSFLVDRTGEIEMVFAGKIKVAGLTTSQAREVIRKRISNDFKSPSVQVRFANFKVSVLGEVANPSSYSLPNEKVTILDALALAGDLTIYGRRENVLIIRDNNGKKEYQRLNLNSSDIFNNPFYYLKQNDVIYVEPNDRKISSTNATRVQTLGVIASLVSALVVVISTFK